MMRLLIAGNSHVGALRKGWDRLAAEHAGNVAVSFFAMDANRLGRMVFTQGRYGVPDGAQDPEILRLTQAINGCRAVVLAEHDHVLLASAPFRDYGLARVLSQFDVDGLAPAAGRRRLSWAAFEATLDDLIRAGETTLPIQAWARALPGRVSLLIWPRPVEAVRRAVPAKGQANPWQAVTLDDAAMRRALDCLEARLTRFYQGLGVRVQPRPPAVLNAAGFTAPRFKTGSMPLSGSAVLPDHDFIHMNAEYGAIVLRDFLSGLPAEAPSALSA